MQSCHSSSIDKRDRADVAAIVKSDPPLVHYIQACPEVSTLGHVIERCVVNSLEAGARDIHIDVDPAQHGCSISDSGRGISQRDLSLLGTWHASSKLSSAESEKSPWAHRGRTIASLCAVSNVEIASRAAGSFETHIISFEGGRLVRQGLADEQRERAGTVIRIRDLFFNRPLCRKKFDSSIGGKGERMDGLQEVVELVQAYAMVHHNVRFTMYDRMRRKLVLTCIHGRSLSDTIVGFFGPQAATGTVVPLSDPWNGKETSEEWNPSQGWRVSGWVVKPPIGYPTRRKQIIFVNGKRCKSSEIVELMDSSFKELCWDIYKLGVFSNGNELLSVKKAKNAYPMYCLALQGSLSSQELLQGEDSPILCLSDWAELLNSLNRALHQAWHEVLSIKMINESLSDDLNSGSSRTYDVKFSEKTSRCSGARDAVGLRSVSSCIGPLGQQDSSIMKGPESGRLEQNLPKTSGSNALWYRERFNKHPVLPKRHSAPALSQTTTQFSLSSWGRLSLASGHTSVRRQKRSYAQFTDQPAVTSDAKYRPSKSLKSWRQRRHHSSSSILPSIELRHQGGKTLEENIQGRGLCSVSNSYWQRCLPAKRSYNSDFQSLAVRNTTTSDVLLANWTNPVMLPTTKSTRTPEFVASIGGIETSLFIRLRPDTLKKRDLIHARALHQIDLKYVPIITASGLLALLDQHAADERVQLEKLKEDVLNPRGGPKGGKCSNMALSTTQTLLLGSDEVPLLDAYGNVLMAWGWRWNTLQRADEKAATKGYTAPFGGIAVEVTHVPFIAGRLLSVADMRLFLHEVVETGCSNATPSGVIRVLNSKSCRTAIMFGDEMTHKECQKLAEDLSKTQMTFVCAHGRPTTVAVADLKALRRAQSSLRSSFQPSFDRSTKRSRAFLNGLKFKILHDLESQ